jgi:hypothetical protein
MKIIPTYDLGEDYFIVLLLLPVTELQEGKSREEVKVKGNCAL